MKKYIFPLLLIVLLIPFCVFSLVSSPDNMFVTDEANKLSVDSENYINRYSTFLYNADRIDYYVVLLDSLEDNDIETYTDYIYETFKIRDKGILILGSTSDRTIRVKVGEDLAYFITDEVIEDYINKYFMPYLKNEDWDMGIINGYKAFYKMLCNIYNIDSSEMVVYDGLDFFNRYKNYIIVIVIWFNTVISYIFCDYFRRIFINKKYNNTIIDNIIFGVCLFINILMFLLSYIAKPIYVVVVLIFELFAIYKNFNDGGSLIKTKNINKVKKGKSRKYKIKTRR